MTPRSEKASQAGPDSGAPGNRHRRGLSAGRLTAIMAAVLVVAIGVTAWFVLRGLTGGRTPVGPITGGKTDHGSFAAEFPAAPDSRLSNPQGIAWTGSLLCVAESDAGVISLFQTDGTGAGRLTVPVAPNARKSYPVDVAALGGDRIVVVDTFGRRAVVMSTDPEAKSALTVLGGSRRGSAPKQPTAVAVSGEEIVVADGGDHDLKVYDRAGRLLRSLAGDLNPKLAFVGGMSRIGDLLYVSDSNAGRVLLIDPATGASRGVLEARMSLPRGVTGDGLGRAYVADQLGQAIRVFGDDHAELFRIGGDQAADGSLAAPRSVAWVPEGRRLFITDSRAGTVKRFDVNADTNVP